MRTSTLVPLGILLCSSAAAAPDDVHIKENYFVTTPKLYVQLVRLDAAKGEVEFLDKDGKSRTLPLRPDAEFLRWWAPAAAEDFSKGLRVWLWISTDDKKNQHNVRVIADEITAMAMHRQRYAFENPGADGAYKLAGDVKGSEKALTLPPDFRLQPKASAGQKVVIQTTTDGGARALLEVYNDAGLEEARSAQLQRVEQRLEKSGVPVLVNLSYDVGGELLVTAGRVGQRWARALNRGDKIELVNDKGEGVPGLVADTVVRGVQTRLTLVVEGKYHARFRLGSPASIKMPKPKLPPGEEPPDVDRVRVGEERIIWLTSQVHCTCPISGESCAGDFLTLWSCNFHKCPQPKRVRLRIDAWITGGKTDGEILKLLRQEQGPDCERFHLRP